MTEYHVRAGGGEGFLPTLAAARSSSTMARTRSGSRPPRRALSGGRPRASGSSSMAAGTGPRRRTATQGRRWYRWPARGHNLERDNYRPPVGSALVGAGQGGVTIGALEAVDDESEEPPVEPPPPPPPLPVEPDWAGLLARVEAAQEQLAVAGMARDAAESELVALRQLLVGYQEHENGGS